MIGELMEGVTDVLNAEAVKRLSASEPTWLQERRAHAWDVYERTPMPTTRLEEWRYTDLRRKLDLNALKLSDAPPAADHFESWPVRLRRPSWPGMGWPETAAWAGPTREPRPAN